QKSELAFVEALAGKGFKSARLSDMLPDDERMAKAEADLLRRLGVAGFAAANVMLLSVAVWSGQYGEMPQSLVSLFHWLSAMITLPAVAYAGQPFFSSARRALAGGRLNMDVPISLGVLLATGLSLYDTASGNEHAYFDAAITLLFFLLIGRFLDQRMRKRAATAAQNLVGSRATAATAVNENGAAERIPVRVVQPGMSLLVAAGERFPVDARLVRDTTEIDESLITGETRPRLVQAGETVHAGTVNLGRPVEVVAEASEESSLLAEITRLMSAAEQSRGQYVRLADRAAAIYAPAVHILGLATLVGWLMLGAGWQQALTAAIAVLIITCPCALALAVPVTQVVAMGRLFRSGLIVKAADGLERLASIDTIVFDKTGTLTLGEPALADAERITDDTLAQAASLATQSRHPYARAVTRAARDRGLTVTPAAGAEEIPGSGMMATIDGRQVRLGSAGFCGLASDGEAAASLYLRIGEAAPVAFAFVDPLRSDARGTVRQLAGAGYQLEVLSGDRSAAVAEAARETGIENWRAEEKPDTKIARIRALKSEGRHVLMVGDGLNDAPALAAGTASLSPSTAADISQTAADAVFQGARLSAVKELLDVARSAHRRAIENFTIALGYNCIFVPLAVMGRVTPLLAAIAMSASSIAVTANALRVGLGSRKEIDP
ncbi:MAG: heavy metal translocating P-type ATPase, partial [Hyphomicrobiaceae bacterium]